MGIIKVMIKNESTILKVISKFFIAIISVFIVLAAFIMIIILSTKLSVLLLQLFDINLDINLTKIIFNNCVGEWYDYSINEIDFSGLSVNNILGDYELNGILPVNWLHNGMINPESFNYLGCSLTLILTLISLLILVIRLIKRVYELIVLYLAIPISLSSIPIDDGMVFKNWLEVFIKRFIVLYSSILIINLFFFMFPVINEFSIENEEVNQLFKLLIIIGSVISLVFGQNIFNELYKFKKRKDKVILEKEINNRDYINIEETITSHRFIEESNKVGGK